MYDVMSSVESRKSPKMMMELSRTASGSTPKSGRTFSPAKFVERFMICVIDEAVLGYTATFVVPGEQHLALFLETGTCI
jgi:hypothetical protein